MGLIEVGVYFNFFIFSERGGVYQKGGGGGWVNRGTTVYQNREFIICGLGHASSPFDPHFFPLISKAT